MLPDAVSAEALRASLVTHAGELLESIGLLDVYRGPGLETGARSLAYRLRLRSDDHTLGEAEIESLRITSIDGAQSETPARLRS